MCRAYGRLKEVDRKELVLRCHGHLMIGAAIESMNAEHFGIQEWDRGALDNGPIRAIVKDLLPRQDPFQPHMIRTMTRQLKELNSLGILVWDVKEDAYLGGTLVDFSQARSQPHVYLDWSAGFWSKEDVLKEGLTDYARFDDNVINEWNQAHDKQIWDRFGGNGWYRRRLRRHGCWLRFSWQAADCDAV
jgi:hypothetical protein